jgi:fido (protein-threonine AMPylation protein)
VDSSYLTQETSGAPRYTAEENEQLTLHLEALTTKVHAGVFSDRPITGDLLRELHGALFDGVRDHAGRTRSATFGHEYLTFQTVLFIEPPSNVASRRLRATQRNDSASSRTPKTVTTMTS